MDKPGVIPSQGHFIHPVLEIQSVRQPSQFVNLAAKTAVVTMAATKPLSRGQQCLLQRLMAAHVLSDSQAIDLFDKLNDSHCNSLEECWKEVNTQLTQGFGLEVATVSLGGTRYHAIVNLHPDDIAKQCFPMFNPHQRAFVRKVLDTIVVQSDGRPDGAVPRMDLVNLKTQLGEPYKVLGLSEAEKCLDDLLDEKWLVVKGNENRRCSMSQEYSLGPRTFLELSHLLKDFGLEDLPQFIFHRV